MRSIAGGILEPHHTATTCKRSPDSCVSAPDTGDDQIDGIRGQTAIPIELTEDKGILVRRYAASKGISVEDAFRQPLFEKIEDEHDISVGEAAYKRYLEDPRTHPHAEVLRMFGDGK